MRVLETGNYVVVHFGLCEAGKGGVGDCLVFFFFLRKLVFFFFFRQEEAGIQSKHSAFEPPDSLP